VAVPPPASANQRGDHPALHRRKRGTAGARRSFWQDGRTAGLAADWETQRPEPFGAGPHRPAAGSYQRGSDRLLAARGSRRRRPLAARGALLWHVSTAGFALAASPGGQVHATDRKQNASRTLLDGPGAVVSGIGTL